ncbi:MAG: FAD-dependent oxidoreductase [Planctomycetes bacterium]|nr:FAD-dependent oxidoreductase [Planctomycetota bacterium]
MAGPICIIGGGVIGLAAARALALRGREVVVLDREREPAVGCSAGNAGMVVPSHFVPLAAPGMVGKGLRWWLTDPEGPFALPLRLDLDLLRWGVQFWRSCSKAHVARSKGTLVRLNLESRKLYEMWSRESGGAFHLEGKGMLMLCATQTALDEEAHMAEEGRALGLTTRVLDADGAQAADPSWPTRVAGAVWIGEDAHLSPTHLLAWLEAECRRLRVAVRRGAEVVVLERDRSRIVGAKGTEQGAPARFDAEEYVVAGGAASSALLRTAGMRVPLQAGKGYSFTIAEPERAPTTCSILVEARVAVTPMAGALRVGGTMELGARDISVNMARLRGIVKSIPRYFPAFDPSWVETVKPWAGLRPCSPDGLPYVGRWPGVSNLIIATGHAMMGLSLAPVTAELVAAVLEGEGGAVALDLLRPERFA